MNLKETIESFVYPHLNYLVQMMADGGKDTKWMGIHCLNDKENFTGGALMLGTSQLFLYQKKTQPEKAELTWNHWLQFAEWAAQGKMATWGKLSALKSLWLLKQAGKWEAIPGELLDKLKKLTEYHDFFDVETMKLRGHATNYLHVAMAVAGYREKLGFEVLGMSEKIFKLFLQQLRARSPEGWMDDSEGYGRFDRYSFLIHTELADTCHALEIPIPQQVKDGVCRSLKLLLELYNPQGDGIAYGRSLSAHGDLTAPEVVSTAAREGWLKEGQKDCAVQYCLAGIKKVLTFWFNREKQSFDLWFNGRTTNRYRQVHRIMEVNLDLCAQLIGTLHNMEQAGLAECSMEMELTQLKKELNCVKTTFLDPQNSFYAVHTPQRIWQLPVVGTGEWYQSPAYYPLPMAPQFVELPPENPSDGSTLPVLLPLAELQDGRIVFPVQYFANSIVQTASGGIEICIKLDAMAVAGEKEPQPLENSGATLRYIFQEDGAVCAYFEYVSEEVPIRTLHMQWMSQADLIEQIPEGALFEGGSVNLKDWQMQPAESVDQQTDYFTPHGPGKWVIRCEKQINGNTATAQWILQQS